MRNVVLVLLYEPATIRGRPLPLARILNAELTLLAARCAITEAEARATEFEQSDEFLGEAERAEVQRLRNVLALLIPGISAADPTPVVQ